MLQQGPYSSALFAAIEQQQDTFDLFIFMTYLYCTTFFGLPLVRHKAVLVPTAHDEPPIHLGIFQQVFTAPRAILYLTPTERAMVRRFFDVAHIPDCEVSIGVDLPPPTPSVPAPLSLLYVGRVHTSKGCEELYDYTVRYKEIDPLPFRLIFAGRADITLPTHPDIEYPGFVSETEKQRLLAACSVVMIPSPFESLSIIALEAWAAGRPVLVNGNCDVLREQALRSNGGLFYRSYAEFAYCLGLLLHRPALREQLGRQGRAFVERWYNWDTVERRLEHALAQACPIHKNRAPALEAHTSKRSTV
jgi:glycosyltransferase involved in cell wall biosynthesis